MGPGARPLLHRLIGSEVFDGAGDARSGRKGENRRRDRDASRQGRVHLHVVCVVPSAAGGRARGVQIVREPRVSEVAECLKNGNLNFEFRLKNCE